MITNSIENQALFPIMRTIAPVNEKLCISTVDGYEMIKKENICYLEADSNYCTINYSNKNIFCSQTLGEVSSRIRLVNFMRIHRSFVINFDKVQAISRCLSFVTMENGSKIPISRSNRKAVKLKMSLMFD